MGDILFEGDIQSEHIVRVWVIYIEKISSSDKLWGNKTVDLHDFSVI